MRFDSIPAIHIVSKRTQNAGGEAVAIFSHFAFQKLFTLIGLQTLIEGGICSVIAHITYD